MRTLVSRRAYAFRVAVRRRGLDTSLTDAFTIGGWSDGCGVGVTIGTVADTETSGTLFVGRDNKLEFVINPELSTVVGNMAELSHF